MFSIRLSEAKENRNVYVVHINRGPLALDLNMPSLTEMVSLLCIFFALFFAKSQYRLSDCSNQATKRL